MTVFVKIDIKYYNRKKPLEKYLMTTIVVTSRFDKRIGN